MTGISGRLRMGIWGVAGLVGLLTVAYASHSWGNYH